VGVNSVSGSQRQSLRIFTRLLMKEDPTGPSLGVDGLHHVGPATMSDPGLAELKVEGGASNQ